MYKGRCGTIILWHMILCSLLYIHWHTGWRTQCQLGWIGSHASNQQESKVWAEFQAFTYWMIVHFIVTSLRKEKKWSFPRRETMEANKVARHLNPTLSRHLAYRWWWGCQPYALTMLYSPWRLLALISFRGCFHYSVIHNMQLVRLGVLNKSNCLIGILTPDLPAYSISLTVNLKFNTKSLYTSVVIILLQLPCTNCHWQISRLCS
jgi:hypothetical protein